MNIDKYFILLKLNSIIYNDDIESVINNPNIKEYINSEKFLYNLSIFINLNSLSNKMDKQVINNILTVIKYINKTSSTKMHLSFIKSTLEQIDDFSMVTNFYREQLLKRSGCYSFKETLAYNPNLLTENLRSLIRRSMANDYDVLNFIVNKDRKCFYENIENYENIYFIDTINFTLYECPGLLKPVEVSDRIRVLLDEVRKKVGDNTNTSSEIIKDKVKSLEERIKK